MVRVIAGVAVASVLSSWDAAAQGESRWFLALGAGPSWPAQFGNAFGRGGTASLALGLSLESAWSVELTIGAHRLPYRDDRFADLFAQSSSVSPDPGPLAAGIHRISAGLEWSPVNEGLVRPLVGLGLTFGEEALEGFWDSQAWGRCPLPGTRFYWSTDPITGLSTVSVVDPQAGCDVLRRDMDLEGKMLGLEGSVGLSFHPGREHGAASLHYSKGTGGIPLLWMDLSWRLYL